MPTIGFATIAESPRDDVVPHIRARLPPDVRVAERGCLDGLTPDEIAALGPGAEEVGIVARLRAGGETLLSHAALLPLMQRVVDELVVRDAADLVVILCGADWSEIRARPLVVNPGLLFPAMIAAIAHGRKLGIVKPSAGQVAGERERYRARGIEAVVTSASPYAGEERVRLASRAARELRDADVDLVWMTCIGMDAAMRDAVAEVTQTPVLLAHALLAGIVSELVPHPNAALV
ncbi:MAG: AroM family protein [Candidatus Dormiibacterota bacterium]